MIFSWVRRLRNQRGLKVCLQALASLQHMLNLAYLKKDYINKWIYYERRLFKQRKKLLKVLSRVRRFKKNSFEQLVFGKIEHCAEIIFSLHLLRFRVEEFALFTICTPEMQAIDLSSEKILRALPGSLFHHKVIDVDIFLENIHAFEAIYNRTLRVVAKEPLVFLFFIQDLYAFYDEVFSLGMIHEKN